MITHARFGHMVALITTKAARWSFEMAEGVASGRDAPGKPMRDDPVQRFVKDIRWCCDQIEEEHRQEARDGPAR